MKKFIKSLIIIVIFSLTISLVKRYYFKDYNIILKDNNLRVDLKYKGLKGAVDFTVDDDKNYYVAYKNIIQYINKNGKSFNVFSDSNMNISSLEYYKGKIYFCSDNSIYCYDINSKKFNNIIKNLPNFGDYKEVVLKINGDYLYASIGSATNSGVVGPDNKWLQENPFGHDISPYKIILRGINFENGKTGSFVNYGSKNIDGQIIPGHFPGNASIIMYNLKTGDSSTFAWGIRNVCGIDFDSRGRMLAIVGGMEDRGLRPVKGDTDYIYIIKHKNWYGWPDYSGGDPINSPKFKGENNKFIPYILDNHPNTNPSAPLYIHKNLSSLRGIAVDKYGKIGEIDDIYFYDDKQKKLFCLNVNGVLKEKLNFSNNTKVSSIKYLKDEIIILDSKHGNIYSMQTKNFKENKSSIRPIIWFLQISIVIVIIYILKKMIDNSTRDKN